MKKLLMITLVLNSITSFACDGLFGSKLEKKMIEELKLDLKSLSYSEGGSSLKYKVKKAHVSSLHQTREDIISYTVKLEMVEKKNPALKKEVFGVYEYNLSDCSFDRMNLDSAAKILNF